MNTQLSQKINSEAVNQNIKPVADFFRMHGDETGTTYSDTLLQLLEIVSSEEMNNPTRSEEEFADLAFHIRQLNQLVLSLRNPVKLVAKKQSAAQEA